MNEKIQSYGPAMRFTTVHYPDLACRVTVDYPGNTITLMQPRHLGGKVETTIDEYDEFEGDMKDFVRYKQAQFKEDVAPVVAEYKRRCPGREFPYYPNDIEFIRRRYLNPKLKELQAAVDEHPTSLVALTRLNEAIQRDKRERIREAAVRSAEKDSHELSGRED